MTFGEKYSSHLVNRMTKEKIPVMLTYKRAEWGDWHTDNAGDGLWAGEKQILGTCQFSVSGCETEKAAKEKIRRYVKEHFISTAE